MYSFTLLVDSMKREWYEEDFNKEKMEQEDWKWTPISTVYKKYVSKRKKFGMNVIEFVVGLALLWVCGRYLSNHPAERISLFSWIGDFVERTQLMFQKDSWSAEDLTRKNQLMTLYSELLEIGENSSCLSASDIESIRSTQELIDSKPIEEFVQREQSYNAIASIFMSKISEECE